MTSGNVGQKVSLRTQKLPRGPTSNREDRPTPPRRRRPNSRGRPLQALAGTSTHRGVAERTGRPSENGGAPEE